MFFIHNSKSDNSSQLKKDKSFINIGLEFDMQINEKVLLKILPWLLGGSLAVGGATYYNGKNFTPSNTENNNRTEIIEPSKQPKVVQLGLVGLNRRLVLYGAASNKKSRKCA